MIEKGGVHPRRTRERATTSRRGDPPHAGPRRSQHGPHGDRHTEEHQDEEPDRHADRAGRYEAIEDVVGQREAGRRATSPRAEGEDEAPQRHEAEEGEVAGPTLEPVAFTRVRRRTRAAAAAQAAATYDRVRNRPGKRPVFTKYGFEDVVPNRCVIVA